MSLEDVLNDCRKLPEMCRVLPISDLRQMVHDYHYSDLLLENEIFGLNEYRIGAQRTSNTQKAKQICLMETKHPELVRWRDTHCNRLKSRREMEAELDCDYSPAGALEFILLCYCRCTCLRPGCYFYGTINGTCCICGWPIPVYW